MRAPQPVRIDVGGQRTSGLWTDAEGEPFAVAIVAPGAGAPMTHPYLEGIAEACKQPFFRVRPEVVLSANEWPFDPDGIPL